MLSRRTLLASASAIAFAALTPASAFWHGAPSNFNGGKSQVNFNFLQTGGDYPFLNCFKTAQSWSALNNASTPITPDMLDANGYPTSFTNALGVDTTGVNTTFFVPSQLARPGNYVVTWTGNGTISVGVTNTLVSGSKTGSGGAGRYVFSTPSNHFVMGISAMPVTDLKVFHVDDEAPINAGKIFGTKFKQRIAEAKFGVLRFLNWQVGNVTNITTWATRKPVSYCYYAGHEKRAGLFAGVTTNSGNAYSVAAPSTWSGLVDKATVTIVFNASASAAPCTLNVGATGDINILNQFATALSAGTNSYPVGGTSQSMATLVYDAVLNAWIKQGGDVAQGSQGLTNGIPPELAFQLAIEVGAHPYFVTPPLSVTPMTDFVPSLAQYCKDHAPSWMIPRFEGPNELWNASNNQTNYANSIATAYGWGNDFHNWMGKVMSTIGQAVSTVYGDDRTKYQVLCGVQTSTGNNSGGTAASNARLASTKYLLQSPQSPYTATASSGWVTHVCCAQYIRPSDYSQASETTLAAAYAGANFTGSILGTTLTTSGATGTIAIGQTIQGVGVDGSVVAPGTTITAGSGTSWTVNNSQTVASQFMTAGADLTAPVTYADTTNSGGGILTLTATLNYYTNWKVWAQGFGIQKMCGYEGGYSPDYTSNGNSDVDRLRAASKADANLSTFTTTNYNNFVGLSGGGFTAEFPSCFQLSGNVNISGYSTDAWSVLEDIYQTANAPQWTAIVAFNV